MGFAVVGHFVCGLLLYVFPGLQILLFLFAMIEFGCVGLCGFWFVMWSACLLLIVWFDVYCVNNLLTWFAVVWCYWFGFVLTPVWFALVWVCLVVMVGVGVDCLRVCLWFMLCLYWLATLIRVSLAGLGLCVITLCLLSWWFICVIRCVFSVGLCLCFAVLLTWLMFGLFVVLFCWLI